jgi:thiaminase
MKASPIPNLQPWLKEILNDVILPKRRAIAHHPFIKNMESGTAEKKDALIYFEGLLWHLLDFGKHVEFLMKKRPAAVAVFLGSRAEDEDGDTQILARIVKAFGGNFEKIIDSPWRQTVHPIWIHHDALLRSAIYSQDLAWQVGVAALNVGIESLVPSMIEPLFSASVQNYAVSSDEAKWLESRSGEEEKQHGENGFLILNEFVGHNDQRLQEQCRFFIQALSDSMAYRLLRTGLPHHAGLL